MLWASLVPDVMRSMLTDINTTENNLRKTETRLRLDYYFDNQLTELETVLSEYFSEPDKMIKCCLNITKKLIDNLSTQYSGQAPKRELSNATDSDNELYQQILVDSKFNATMKLAARLTKLLKTVVVRVLFVDGKIKLRILTGDILDVTTHDSDVSLLEKILIEDAGDTYQETEFSLWTKNDYKRLSYNGTVIDQEPNPYNGVLPFVPLFDRIPTDSFWLPGGDDIISYQTAINTLLVDANFLIRMGAHGIHGVKGMTGGNITASPGTFFSLPKDGDLISLSQHSQIKETFDAISKQIKFLAVSNGLSAMVMQTEPVSSNRQSGVSKAFDTMEMSEKRADAIDLFRSFELEIFEKIKAVYNYHTTGKKLSEKCSLSIDFADPTKLAVTAIEQAQADDYKINQGVLSPVDVLIRDNPDLQNDRQKALEHLLLVKRENAQLQPETL